MTLSRSPNLSGELSVWIVSRNSWFPPSPPLCGDEESVSGKHWMGKWMLPGLEHMLSRGVRPWSSQSTLNQEN